MSEIRNRKRLIEQVNNNLDATIFNLETLLKTNRFTTETASNNFKYLLNLPNNPKFSKLAPGLKNIIKKYNFDRFNKLTENNFKENIQAHLLQHEQFPSNETKCIIQIDSDKFFKAKIDGWEIKYIEPASISDAMDSSVRLIRLSSKEILDVSNRENTEELLKSMIDCFKEIRNFIVDELGLGIPHIS